MPNLREQEIQLSIVLPALNEEENVGLMVEDAAAHLSFLDAFEIIVVDDGSTDATAERVKKLQSRYPFLQLISFADNQGYGQALRTGFAKSRGKMVFFTDCDCQFHFDDLPSLLSLIQGEELDMVVGFRLDRKDSAIRLCYSKVYNRLASLICGLRVRDVNCAYKLFSRDSLSRMQLFRNDYLINAEMFSQAVLLHLKVKETPVRHYPRKFGESKVGGADIYRSISGLFSLRSQTQVGKVK